MGASVWVWQTRTRNESELRLDRTLWSSFHDDEHGRTVDRPLARVAIGLRLSIPVGTRKMVNYA